MTRTGATGVWKPPPEGGTLSQPRADRWQGKNSSPRSPASSGAHKGNKSPKGQNTVHGAISKFKGANAKTPEKEWTEDELERHTLWFAKLEQPKGGELSSQHKIGPKVGMSAPPQNEAVQRELLEYLKFCEVKPHVERRRPRLSSTDGRVSADSSPSRSATRTKNPLSPSSQTLSPARSHAGTLDPKCASFKSLGSTSQSLSGALSTSPGGGTTKRKPTLEPEAPVKLPLNEDQIRWKTHEFHRQSREHGFDMSQRKVEDLAELSVCHNTLIRSKSTGQISPQGLSASGKLRSLGLSLTSGFDDNSASAAFGMRKLGNGKLDFGECGRSK